MRFIDLSGQQFGRLTVLRRCEEMRPRAHFLCLCKCGNYKTVSSEYLRRSKTSSCGCLARELSSKQGIIYGKINGKLTRKHGASETPEYTAWACMVHRCNNSNAAHYKNYGARGISVCEKWLVFSGFIEDMGRRPSNKHSIDRINNDGNYEPSNCRWATLKEQNANKRCTRNITHAGKTQCLKAWASEYRINISTLTGRLRRGWNMQDALTSF